MGLKAPKKDLNSKRIRFDITGYDRTTIMWQIRSAYRYGYKEIDLHYDNVETSHLRKAERLPVSTAIQQQVGHTLGGTTAIVDAHNAKVIIDSPTGDPDIVIHRLVGDLLSMHHELMLLTKGHLYAASLIDEKHDLIQKLVAYGQLLLTPMQDLPSAIKYHLLGSIDKIADIIKYMGRYYIALNKPFSPSSISLLQSVHEYLKMYETAYEKYSTDAVLDTVVKRDEIKRVMRSAVPSMDPREAFLIGQEICIVELVVDMLESRMSLEVQPK